MTMREREGLIRRIRQIRRTAVTPTTQPQAELVDDIAELTALQNRVGHLEALVEALQDSVHRESERQSRRLAELEAQIQPAALGVALERDARERGL
jgi:hypothetical protein